MNANSKPVKSLAACEIRKILGATKKPDRKVAAAKPVELRKLNAKEIINLHARAHAADSGAIRELNADEIFDLRCNGTFECWTNDDDDADGGGRKLSSDELVAMYALLQAKNPEVIRKLSADEIHDLRWNLSYTTY